MKTRQVMFLTVAMASAIASSPAFARYGLSDGGFDSQGGSVTTFCYLNNPGSDCPAGVWNGFGSGFILSGNASWGGLTAPSSSFLAFLQADGHLSQTFTASETRRVVLTWLEADRPYFGGQTYLVSINGTAIGTFTSWLTSWTKRVSAPFDIVAGNTYTITFTGMSATDKTALLDSVDLASSQSTTSYSYDALGRLRSVQTAGGSNDGLTTSYTFDAASNRTQVTVTGAP